MGRRLYSGIMFLLVSVIGGVLVAGIVVPGAGMASAATKVGTDTLSSLPEELETPPQSERSRVLLADGSVLTYFFDENRLYVPLKDIAPIMRTAQIAIEDDRFYQHGALDLRGTMRALLMNVKGGGQGGSTLTQQYVKLVQVEAAAAKGDTEGVQKAQERTLARKIQELRYAVAVEQKLTKDQILERYLNIAYYGDGAYGVEAAAHHYFNIKASQLNLAQASLLAGLVQNPVTTDPVNNPRSAMERRAIVLARMAELNLITPQEAAAAKAVPFDKSKVQRPVRGCASSRYPFLCDYVEKTLLNTPSLGKDKQTRKNLLYRGGLTIQTMIDPKTQDAAEKAVTNYVNPKDPVIATVNLIQPGTGLIIAMAQNRPQMGTKPGQTYYNYNVSRSMGGAEGYQAGSTFKAFTMAAALEAGITPYRRYNSPAKMDFTGRYFTSCSGRFRSSEFPVKNVSPSGRFNMLQAAQYSVNTYFVQLAEDVSLCAATKMADRVGVELAMGGTLQAKYNEIPSFTLGTAEVTPLSMAEAYATFAARGKHCEPIIIKSVKTRDNKSLAVPNGNCQQVMDQGIADTMNLLLSQPFKDGGTLQNAWLSGVESQAGKTGTIDGQAAIWTVGYTPELAGAAMIAVDKTNPFWRGRSKSVGDLYLPASGTYLSGSSGGNAGRYLWRPAMQVGLQGRPATSFVYPPDSVLEGKKVRVPDCSGLGYEGCVNAVAAAGFNPYREYEYSGYEAGTFLGYTYPGGGSMVSMGSDVGIVVSAGPRPKPKPTTKKATKPTTTKPTTTKTTKKA